MPLLRNIEVILNVMIYVMIKILDDRYDVFTNGNLLIKKFRHSTDDVKIKLVNY